MIFIIVNIACIMVVAAVHELGHYIILKKYGITPAVFSVGWGWEIFGFNFRGTRFTLRPAVVVGYNEMSKEDKNLDSLTSFQKIVVYLAGPLANLFLCMVIGMFSVYIGITPVSLHGLTQPELYTKVILETPVLFFELIPEYFNFFYMMISSPLETLPDVAGPIRTLSGTALDSRMFGGLGYKGQIIATTWLISGLFGTFNLLPIKYIDGGYIFEIFFSTHTRFIALWEKVTLGLLVTIGIYAVFADLFYLYGLLKELEFVHNLITYI